MLCLCRLSPMRLFLRGMSQVHISEPAATARALQRTGRDKLTMPQLFHKSLVTTTSPAQDEKNSPRPRKRDNETKDRRRVENNGDGNGNGDSAAPMAKKKRPRTEGAKTKAAKVRKELESDSNGDGDGAGPKPKKENWKAQKAALKEKFPEGWRPRKRLSPDAIEGIRAVHAQFPDQYTTPRLAREFEVSPEAIRRILRSKWRPSSEEEEKRQERWFRRGVSVWTRHAELGTKPPRKWRKEGAARDPAYHENRKAAIERRKREGQEEQEAAEAAEDSGEKPQRQLGDSIM